MKEIAVIGGGVSGLSTAWLLARQYKVTLYEREPYVGGHAHTINISFSNKTFPVDVGFMVFNPIEYPHFIQLLKHLNVETRSTTMSFSVSVGDGDVEFSGAFPSGIFADWKNIFRPRFLKFLFEILRFNKRARHALRHNQLQLHTVKSFLDIHKFSTFFRSHYLYPMAGSIWSGSFGDIEEFPAQTLFEFLNRHHLLEVRNKPKWYTVVGGSRVYVQKLLDELTALGGSVKLGKVVSRVERQGDQWCVSTQDESRLFDKVVMATHPDVSLSTLKGVDVTQTEILKHFHYNTNKVVVHSDPSNMPKRKAAWASWNFCCPPTGRAEHIYLTYHMNSLQHIDERYPVFVTLNPLKNINKNLIHAQFSFRHPLFNNETKRAQEKVSSIQGINGLYFVGAWTGYGFHEDGLRSAVQVAQSLDISVPWKI